MGKQIRNTNFIVIKAVDFQLRNKMLGNIKREMT